LREAGGLFWGFLEKLEEIKMGRVYEALNKAEPAPIANGDSVAGEGMVSTPDGQERGGDPEGRNFRFVSYSLDAPSLTEIQRIKREEDIQTESRMLLTRPSRTVELDRQRVDRRLTPSYESPSRIADEFNRAAIALISAASESPIKRVLVTAANHGSGKTLTAINLPFALARARKRVLLIDTDLKRPSILRMLALEADIGLSEISNAEVRPGDGAIKVMPYGLTVIPMRAPVENSAELLGDARFRSLLNEFEPDYDFILLDSGPLLHSADAALLARLTDRVILVIAAGSITSSQLGRAISALNREQLLGVVLNRFEQRSETIN